MDFRAKLGSWLATLEDMSNGLTIAVEGIDDTTIVADIEKAIHESFRDTPLPGSWRIAVRPSHVSGRWDFRIHGLDVRHTLSITAPPGLLSGLIPRRLRESINRSGLCRNAYVAVRTRERASGAAIAHTVNAVSRTSAPVGTV